MSTSEQLPKTRGMLMYKPQNKDYNRSLTSVGAFDVFVPTAAIFPANRPGLVQ